MKELLNIEQAVFRANSKIVIGIVIGIAVGGVLTWLISLKVDSLTDWLFKHRKNKPK